MMQAAREKSLFLWSCFHLQYKVIHALILREIHTRYGRENIGFLWVIGEPILFCAGVTIVWTAIRPAREHGLGMTTLVVTGYLPLTMWRHSLARAVKAYEANGSLLFHRQVTPFDIITARVFLEIIGTAMAAIVLHAGTIAFGYMKPPADLSLFFLGYFYQAIFSFATALLVASLSELSDLVEKIVSVLSYLALPLSGAFIMVSWLPLKYQWILLLSPMANNTEIIRAGQFGMAARVKYDLFYDTWFTLLILLVGIVLTERIRKHIEIV